MITPAEGGIPADVQKMFSSFLACSCEKIYAQKHMSSRFLRPKVKRKCFPNFQTLYAGVKCCRNQTRVEVCAHVGMEQHCQLRRGRKCISCTLGRIVWAVHVSKCSAHSEDRCTTFVFVTHTSQTFTLYLQIQYFLFKYINIDKFKNVAHFKISFSLLVLFLSF